MMIEERVMREMARTLENREKNVFFSYFYEMPSAAE